MTAARRWNRSVVATCATALAIVSASCLDDLPAPTTCPPPAVVEATSCFGVFQRTEPGCITFQEGGLAEMSCLTGARTSCDCLPDECPAVEDACYPRRDCPGAVTDAVGDDADCRKLEVADFAPVETVVQASQCVCGCFACAAVCDGKGPAFGIVNDGTPAFASAIIAVDERLPDAGTLGLYLRARGFSNVVVYVVVGPIDAPEPELVSASFLSTSPDTFGDHVFVGEDNLLPEHEGQAYSWTSADRKPTFIVIVPPGPVAAPGDPSQSLWELDCIVPFVVP